MFFSRQFRGFPKRPSTPRPQTPHPLTKNKAGEVVGQLPMFMTAREILESHQPLEGDRGYGEGDQKFWRRKLRESMRSGLAKSIIDKGVQAPVNLTFRPRRGQARPEIVGGHHRIAVSDAVNPDRLMPVTFHESLTDAQMNKHYPYNDDWYEEQTRF